MPRIQIDGVGTFEVDAGFGQLSPEQQSRAVEEMTQAVRSQRPASQPPGSGSGVAPLAEPTWRDRLRTAFGGSDTAADVAIQAGAGTAAGVAQTAGLPGTMQMLPARVYDFAARQANEHLGANLPVGLADIVAPSAMPDGQRVQRAMEENITGPLPAPQTTAGRYTRAVAEAAPTAAALGPAAGMRSLGATNLTVNALVPAVASEAAGDLVRGTTLAPYEGPIRAGVGLVTGVGGNVLAAPGRAERIAGATVRNVDDATWRAADQLMRDAESIGIRLTVDEALNFASGGATSRLSALRRVIDQTPGGGERMGAAMADRIPAMETASRSTVANIGPGTATPSANGPAVQAAAQESLDRARQAGNRLAEPYYQVAQGERVGAAEHARLMQDPAYAAAFRQVRGDEILNGPLAHLPDDAVPVVHQVMQQLDRNITASRQTVTNPQGNNRIAGLTTGARQEADNTARSASPAFGQAQDIVSEWNRRVMTPLESGPLGRAAATANPQAQAAEFTGNLAGSEREVMRAARELARRNPEAAQQLARQAVEEVVNRAFGSTGIGQIDQFSGARLAGEIMRDAQSARNYGALIEATAGPQARAEFDRSLRVLAATGARPRAGSGTTFNTEWVNEMQGGNLAAAGISPLRTARDAIRGATLGRTSASLADLALDGSAGLARLREAAGRGPLADLARFTVAPTALADREGRRPQ